MIGIVTESSGTGKRALRAGAIGDGAGELLDDVGGEKACGVWAEGVTREIAGVAVEMGAEDGGFEGRDFLADERGNYAGESVPGAGGSHGGVAGGVDGDTRAVGDDGAVAFEEDDGAGAAGEELGEGGAVRFLRGGGSGGFG